MPINAPYLLVVSMDVESEHEDLFNDVYDNEHIPYLLEVPGVVAAQRMKTQAYKMFMGGKLNDNPAMTPAYTATYELENPDVLTSEAWAEAVERGRWPSVRQYVSNRRSALYKLR